jgi:hypothetical protein
MGNADKAGGSRAIERLAAAGPASPEPGLLLYAPLVGAWSYDWTAFDTSGRPAERASGEWHFSWILGGLGVQDVIWVTGAPPAEDGTTLRCWDAGRGIWRVAFMSPADGEFVSLIGRRHGDEIRQQVIEPATASVEREWNFSQITPAGFLWQARSSSDGGSSWAITHEIRAARLDPTRVLGEGRAR